MASSERMAFEGCNARARAERRPASRESSRRVAGAADRLQCSMRAAGGGREVRKG
jgi:hypothetical protein